MEHRGTFGRSRGIIPTHDARGGHDKASGAERAQALDTIVQSDAIHRFEDFEPTELRKQLDQAVLDGFATCSRGHRP